jgi:transcriptional regulator with XRE-family HTH domain
MTLQEIFVLNLKKFRKSRGVSQMTLAELCDTSGNYIGEIEMGRRIPSFEKIEKIASALNVASYQLFIEESDENLENQELPTTKDYLNELPKNVKKEIMSHILDTIQKNVIDSFDPKNYQ